MISHRHSRIRATLISVRMLVASATASARTMYVDSANTSDTEDGSALHPFTTILEAHDGSAHGDTISIARETYAVGTLTVRSSVAILGASPATTVIHGAFVLSSSLDTLPVTIAHLTIDNVARSDSGTTWTPLIVRDCIAAAIVDATVMVDSMAPLLIRSVEVLDSVHIDNASCKASRTIEDSRVHGSFFLSSRAAWRADVVWRTSIGRALTVQSRSMRDTLFIADNTIGDSLAIDAVATGGARVQHNVIGSGIRTAAVSGGSLTLIGNTVTSGSISVSGVSQTTDIDSNTLANGGITIEGVSPHATVRNNHITSDGTVSGIRAVVATGIVIAHNVIDIDYVPPTGKPFAADTLAVGGVTVVARAAGGVYGNRIRGGSYGIYVNALASKPISRNDVADAHHGISVVSASCRLDSNHVSRCKGDGVVVGWLGEEITSDSSHISMHANTVSDNHGSGIRLQNYAFLWEPDTSDRRGGENRLIGNGAYALLVATPDTLIETIPARMNYWQHVGEAEIDQFDIWDGKDDPSRAVVAFMPFAVMGVDDESGSIDATDVQIVPHPLVGQGWISYRLARRAHVRLRLFDLVGHELPALVDEAQEGGEHQVPINARGIPLSTVPAGIYLCVLNVEGESTVRRLIVR